MNYIPDPDEEGIIWNGDDISENEFGDPDICDCESCQRAAGTW